MFEEYVDMYHTVPRGLATACASIVLSGVVTNVFAINMHSV